MKMYVAYQHDGRCCCSTINVGVFETEQEAIDASDDGMYDEFEVGIKE
jgi:hypothetical protein